MKVAARPLTFVQRRAGRDSKIFPQRPKLSYVRFYGGLLSADELPFTIANIHSEIADWSQATELGPSRTCLGNVPSRIRR